MNLSLTPEVEQFIQHNIWKDLNNFMSSRIAAAKSGDVIMQSFDSIINEAKNG